MENEILMIFSQVLNLDLNKISLETKRDELEEWDSLAHIRLVSEIEEQLGITIPFEKVSEIKMIGDFIKFCNR